MYGYSVLLFENFNIIKRIEWLISFSQTKNGIRNKYYLLV